MPEIVVKLGDKIVSRHNFDKDVISVGRARDNDIVLENLSVSRNHARVRKADGKFILTDLNSANGTMVNSVRVTKHEIVDGDQIQVGKHTLTFVAKETESAVAPPHEGVLTIAEGDSNAPLGPPGMLTVTKGKQETQRFRLVKAETTLGRSNENDVRLHDWFVSKKHAVISHRGGMFYIKDLQSWRGTTLNGAPVRGEVQLRTDDELTLGTTVLRFADRIPEELEAAMIAEEEARARALLSESQQLVSSTGVSQPGELVPKDLDPNVTGGVLPPPPPIAPPPPEFASGEQRRTAEDQARIPAPSTDIAPKTTVEAGEDGSDDDFSPMTDDELAALEAESEAMVSSEHIGHVVTAEWENFELENMASMNERVDEHRPRIGEDVDHRKEEEAMFKPPSASVSGVSAQMSMEDLKAEEEALHGGMPEAGGESRRGTSSAAVARPTAHSPSGTSDLLRDLSETPLPPPDMTEEERQRLMALWSKALRNKSVLIRKNAAKELKKLTGKDYDWESAPAEGP